MNGNIVYNSVALLPRIIRDYSIGTSVQTFNNAMFDKYFLEDAEQQVLLGIEAGLLTHTIQPTDIGEIISINLPDFTPEESKSLAASLITEFCGSARWYFTALPEAAAAQGIELPEINPFPVVQPRATLDAATSEIMKSIDDAPETMKPKVAEYLREVLKSQQYEPEKLRTQLGNSVSDGGFGLSADRTHRVMVQILNIVGSYDLQEIPEPPRKRIDPASLPKSFLEPHEIDDILATGAAANKIGTGPDAQLRQMLIDSILAAAPLEGQPQQIRDRWRSIVESRVADVRDAAATKALLTGPISSGGLAMPPYQADALADRLENAIAGAALKKNEISVLEKIASVQKDTAHLAIGPEEKQKSQQHELNQQFVGMFGKKAVEQMRAETRREIAAPEVAHPGENLHDLTPAIVAPNPAPIQTPPPAPKVPEKLKLLIDAESPYFPLKPKAPVAAAAAPAPKKTTDIKASPRFLGPIDELRTMSLIDFRRLSPDPAVRIQKIRSKMQVIAGDGGSEQIAAVQAFELSEPVKLYKEILREAIMKLQSVEAIAAARGAAANQTLDPAEVTALKDFLQKIRYSGI